MAALLHEIDALGRFDEAVIAAHGRNIEGLREFIAPYCADVVADVVGLRAGQIRRLADTFSAAGSAGVHMSTGVNMGRHGTLCYWLLQMLSFVTGNLDKVGGNFYGEGFYPAAKAGRIDLGRVFFSSRFGEMRTIRGTLSANLLPCTNMLERPDINICGLDLQYEPFVQYTDAVAPPIAERREEWWIFARLLQARGAPSVLDQQPPRPFACLEKMLARSDISMEQLRASPCHTVVLDKKPLGRFYSDFIQTDERRVDCCPALFAEAIASARTQFDATKAAPAW